MSLSRTIYHIDQGPKNLYPVDAAAALRHPEWSATPWTDEMIATARPRLDERKREQDEAQRRGVEGTLVSGQSVVGAQVTDPPVAQQPASGQTGDRKTDAETLKRLQSELDEARQEAEAAGRALEAVKTKGSDNKATAKAQADVDAAEAKVAEAQARIDAAKPHTSKSDAAKK